MFGAKFGATAESDVYFQIFGVVTLVFTGVGVALQTLVIKNLNSQPTTDDARRSYVAGFITRVFFACAAVTAALYAGAPYLVSLLLPELRPDLFPTALTVTYIMLPSLTFVVIAYIISGVLQNSRVFFIPSIISLPYNVLIISQLLFFDPDIIAVSVATTIGWALHVAFQLPSFYRRGYRLAKLPRGGAGAFAVREAAAIFLSNMVFQICFIIDRSFVSGSEGAITSVNYASNLFVTVSSVFVVAMSSVIFPAISKNYAEGKLEYVRRLVGTMIMAMTVIFVPYLLVASVFGGNIVSLIWERGSFTADAARLTSTSFIIYSFGVFGYIAQELFSKILYLSSRYAYTVAGAAAVAALKLATDSVIEDRFGIAGVAISTTALLTAYAIFITIKMRSVIGSFVTRKMIADALRTAICALSSLAVYFIFRFAAPGLCADRIKFLIPLLVCGVVYVAALFATGLFRSLANDMKSVRDR